MKFNFKKIASVMATTVMLGSTVAFAAAAWPAPFVNGGVGDAAIVYGSGGAASDMNAAVDLGKELDKDITVTTGTGTVAGGDSVKLERANDKFNLNDQLDDFYTTLDNEEFTMVLADGVYLNDDNNEYDYEQKIALGASALTFFQDSGFNNDEPIVGFDLGTSTHIMNYTLDFTPDNAEGGATSSGDEYPKMDNTNLKMLGKEFYISSAEQTANGVELTLLDSANTAIIGEGDPAKTMLVGAKSYEVSIDFINNDEVALKVNGQVTNSLNEGETYKLTDGTYVGIKNIQVQDYAGGVKKVEFSLGTGKIVLENGQEVQINEEDISTLEDANGYTSVITAYITNSSTTIDKIVLEWNLDDDAWIAPGTELIMPGFNAIKLSMAAWNAPKQEMTTIDDQSDSVKVSTAVKDGDVELSILYANSSVSGFVGLGEKASHKLVTNATSGTNVSFNLNETDNSYFVTTWINGDDAESYVYEITSITDNNGKNTTKLENLASGGSDLEFSEVTDTEDRGQITFTLVGASDTAKTATVRASASTGTVYGNLLTTKEGLTMRLPVNSVATGDGNINLSAAANPTTHVINFTEEDNDGSINTASSFTVTVGLDAGDGTEPTATSLTMFEETDGSDWDVGYKVSDLATKVRLNSPSNGLGEAEIIYAGDESTADVYITEAAASITGAGKVAVVKDSEVDSVKGKNLVVVGGSCINSVAASMLGSTSPLCGADFSAKTNVGAGKYLIKVAASPVNAAKIAMLIAGYEAADTSTAVAKVKEGTTSTDVHEEVGPLTV